MSDNGDSSNKHEVLMQKLDDVEFELENQNGHLKVIKILLIIMVVLQLPIAYFAISFLYEMLHNPF